MADPLPANRPLEGRLVRLRALEPEDVPTLTAWLNDPEIQQHHGTRYPRNVAEIERRNATSQGVRYSAANFAVVALDDGALVGEVSLHAEHPEMRSGQLGITIGDKSRWDRGYGTDTVRTVCRFGFEMMNLHRIELHVFSENARAQRAYEKVGFRREGVMREAIYKFGHYMDDIAMGLLEGELILG